MKQSQRTICTFIFAFAFAFALFGLCVSPTSAQQQSSSSSSFAGQDDGARSLDPWNLQVVDPQVGDLNSLGTSFRQLEVGLAEPNDFRKVFRVPGRDDLLMRVQGGIYAVFPQSVYRTFQTRRESFTLPVVPHNTMFYIGREALEQAYGLGRHAARGHAAAALPMNLMLPAPARERIDTAVDTRADDARDNISNNNNDIAMATSIAPMAIPSSTREARAVAQNGRAMHEGDAAENDVALGAADHQPVKPRESTRIAIEAPALPPIASDADYRRVRLAELLRRAAEAEADSASGFDTGSANEAPSRPSSAADSPPTP